MNRNDSIYMLTGVDALGRKILPVSGFNSKQVGLFYFLWIGQHGSADYDNSVLPIEAQRNDRSGENVHHYWAKPLMGYYDSGDPWVFERHLQMLTYAGVDYLVFDTTNSYYYKSVCDSIFPVALKMLDEGWNIPRFIFDTNCRSSETVRGIYEAFYNPQTEAGKKYARLWYRHPDSGNRNAEGKPWIIAKNNEAGDNAKYNYSQLPDCIKNFFYLRESAWFKENEVPYAFATDIDTPAVHEGMLSVSVAQHTSGAFSDSVFEQGARDRNRGRGWVYNADGTGTNVASNVNSGTNYQSEWEAALSNPKVDNVFLSTFNEWVAQKQPYGGCGRSCCYFVDQYNTEFSRDIEPSDNELGDNYFMQTVLNIRRFKGKTGKIPAATITSVNIRGGDDEWRGATEYSAFCGVQGRNYKSSNRNLPPYTAPAAANDITGIKVACDRDSLYFRIDCAQNISKQYSCGDYLNLIISSGGSEYVVNSQKAGERISVTRDGKTVGYADGCVRGNSICFAVSRATIGQTDKDCEISFQVTDGVSGQRGALDRYVAGKCVPIGRLKYAFICTGEGEGDETN